MTVLSWPSHLSSLMTVHRAWQPFSSRALFRNDTAIGSANEPHRGKKEGGGELKRGTISSLNAHASEFTRLLLCVFPVKRFEIQSQCSLANEGEECNSPREAPYFALYLGSFTAPEEAYSPHFNNVQNKREAQDCGNDGDREVNLP